MARSFPISFQTIPNHPIHNKGPDQKEMGEKHDRELSGRPCVGGLTANIIQNRLLNFFIFYFSYGKPEMLDNSFTMSMGK